MEIPSSCQRPLSNTTSFLKSSQQPSLPLSPSQNAYISVTDRSLWGTILRLLQALLPHTGYEIRQEEEWSRLYLIKTPFHPSLWRQQNNCIKSTGIGHRQSWLTPSSASY